MAHPLFTHIDNFNSWANGVPHNEAERGDDWECHYPEWADIYTGFEILLQTEDVDRLSPAQINRLFYIIARDNESEVLADILTEFPPAFATFAKLAAGTKHNQTKWQLAARLPLLPAEFEPVALLEPFVNDADEYVSRRALMALANVEAEKTEHYCEKFWHRQKPNNEHCEHQRMAVLFALKTIQSPRLKHFLSLAKQDGRQHLLAKAMEIENEIG